MPKPRAKRTVQVEYQSGGLLEQLAAAQRRRDSRNRALLLQAKGGRSVRKGRRLPWEGV